MNKRTILSVLCCVLLLGVLNASITSAKYFDSKTVAENISLSITADRNEFQLNLYANEGTFGTTNVNTYTGKDLSDSYTFALPGTYPSRVTEGEHYAFIGWGDTSNATTPSYYPESSCDVTADSSGTGEENLYAIWETALAAPTCPRSSGAVLPLVTGLDIKMSDHSVYRYKLDNSIDITQMRFLEFDFYLPESLKDKTVDSNAQIELTSSGVHDVDEFGWTLGESFYKQLVNGPGWNHVVLQLNERGFAGSPDDSKIDFIGIYWGIGNNVNAHVISTIDGCKIKNLHFTKYKTMEPNTSGNVPAFVSMSNPVSKSGAAYQLDKATTGITVSGVDGVTSAVPGQDLVLTLEPQKGSGLPTTVYIEIGGSLYSISTAQNALSNDPVNTNNVGITYHTVTRQLTIPGSLVTGSVEIIATAT